MPIPSRAGRLLIVAIALSVAAAACSSDTDSPAGPDGGETTTTTVAPDSAEASTGSEVDPSTPPPVAVASSITDEQIDEAIAALDGIAEDALARSQVPGMAIAVVHDDEVVYAEGFGVRDTSTGEAVGTDTVFQIASLSKPLAATTVARVVGEGQVAWDDPVVAHLPDFALSDPVVTERVTIADLFSHRSGLPDHIGDLLEDMGYDRATILERLRYVPLDAFRDSYAYTNFGFTAAAEATAAAAGLEWADLMAQELYEPLGMTSTSSRFADFEAASDRAVTHVQVDGEWVPRYVRDPDAQSPAGGVSSTAADMAQWLRLRLAEGAYDGEQLVDADALAATTTPQSLSSPPGSPEARSGFYGLGIGVGTDWTGRVRLSHSGAFGLGAATVVSMLPSEDLGIVVLTNGAPVGVPESVANTFLDLVEVGHPERDWLTAYGPQFAQMFHNPSELAGEAPPELPAPARADDAYLGTYANDYYGEIEVVAAEGGVALGLGPERELHALTHWDGDVFSYEPTGENAVGISAVTFTAGTDGRAELVVVENLDAQGLGTFTRSA